MFDQTWSTNDSTCFSFEAKQHQPSHELGQSETSIPVQSDGSQTNCLGQRYYTYCSFTWAAATKLQLLPGVPEADSRLSHYRRHNVQFRISAALPFLNRLIACYLDDPLLCLGLTSKIGPVLSLGGLYKPPQKSAWIAAHNLSATWLSTSVAPNK